MQPTAKEGRSGSLSEGDGEATWLTGPGRGWVIAGLVMLSAGAIASAVRPLIRSKFAAADAARRSAVAASRGEAHAAAAVAGTAAAATPAPTADVAAKLARLQQLNAAHRARHPLWYGEPTPELVSAVRKVLAETPSPIPAPDADLEATVAAAAAAAAGQTQRLK
jgi:hypothetical protein